MNGTHYVAYRFAVELLLSSAVYVLPFWHRRKAGFCWKLPLGIAICMVLSVFLGHWSQRLLLRQFVRYMVLFLGVTGLIYWCFALERYGALFCSVSAYATQHFIVLCRAIVYGTFFYCDWLGFWWVCWVCVGFTVMVSPCFFEVLSIAKFTEVSYIF